MKRCLTLISALLLLQTSLFAQYNKQAIRISLKDLPPGVKAEYLQARLKQLAKVVYGGPIGVHKATAGDERLVAIADYDFTLTPGTQLEDSMSFTYAPGRGSAFNYDALTYDYFNNEDIPTPFPSGGYIQFDSLRMYNPPGSPTSSVFGFRVYNDAGKVIRDENPTVVATFIYDAANRLQRSTVFEYDPLTARWDSSYRDFYTYNSSGYLIRDSSESWDSTTSSYQPSGNLVYSNNAAGYPVMVSLDFVLGPVTLTFLQIDITYAMPANKASRVLYKVFDGAGFQDVAKDTIGYSGSMMKYYNSYDWDTATNAWALYYEERRRLNAANLPDSVGYYVYNDGEAVDSAILRLGYNAQENPAYLRVYVNGKSTPDIETRWYHEPITGVGIAALPARKDLLIYPNPVENVLYIKGNVQGRYSIHNNTGQLVQSGTMQGGAGVPLHMLSPGTYSISMTDGAGVTHSAPFIKR